MKNVYSTLLQAYLFTYNNTTGYENSNNMNNNNNINSSNNNNI